MAPDPAAWRWAAPGRGDDRPGSCPNCGAFGPQRPMLSVPWPRGEAACLRRCAACGCGFFAGAAPADYAAEQPGGAAALAFYLQQGAGLRGIAAHLAGLGLPPRTRLLEIGCGFGFGLDFARRALGWKVLGLDPSPMAAAGRRQLGLPIEPREMRMHDPALQGRFDVVMASEVIEHVAAPPGFVHALHDALHEGGCLVLTTPDVEAVRPETPAGLLVPLISAGFHLVLQSRRSLAGLLARAGFDDVEVSRHGGASLLARARRPGGRRVGRRVAPRVAGADVYRAWLQDAAADAAPGSDLWFGLWARAYREAVGAGEAEAADALWPPLAEACRQRFGAGPEALAEGAGLELAALARREPLCLGPLLLHRGLHRLLTGAGRGDVEAMFAAAARACRRLRQALAAIGSDDGDAEDVGWVAGAEALLCAAERGAAGVPAGWAALGAAPAGAARGAQFGQRIFTSLVNAGCYADAAALAGCLEDLRALPADAVLADAALDALYCGAVLALQPGQEGPDRALDLLHRLQAARRASGAAGSAATLARPAREAESLALRMLGQG